MSRTKHHHDAKFITTGKGSFKRTLQKDANRKIRHMKIKEDSNSQEIRAPKTVRFDYW